MKLIVSEIRKTTFTETFTFDELVDVSELELLNNDIRKIGSVQVKGTCIVDGDELIFSYTIDGTMILPCARTLVDVDYPFSFQVMDVFTTATETSREDIVYQITEDILDLKPHIIENIIIGTPYRVFSDEKVLEKGEGWSYFTEEELSEQRKNKVDPRLAKLKGLFNNNNDET